MYPPSPSCAATPIRRSRLTYLPRKPALPPAGCTQRLWRIEWKLHSDTHSGRKCSECIYEFLKQSGGRQGRHRDSESRCRMTQREKSSDFSCCVIPCPCRPPDCFLEFVNKRPHFYQHVYPNAVSILSAKGATSYPPITSRYEALFSTAAPKSPISETSPINITPQSRLLRK